MSYSWDFSVVFRYSDILRSGLMTTFLLTAIAVALGLLIGTVVALMRSAHRKILVWPAKIYIEVFRDLPVLVVLIWLYFCLPILIGSNVQISSFWVAALGLSLNFSALQAEIMRMGFEAIPNGELEAARGLGFSKTQILCNIIIPQAFWRSLAPTLGQAINTLKLTSLASFIVVPELFYQTGILIQETYRPLELYTTLAALYLVVILPMSIGVQAAEARLSSRFRNG
jgi:polar amino acid transport system permease protein